MEANLLCDSVPDEYDSLSLVYWHRIYTTNIDNIVETVYRGGEPRLDIISCPNDEPKERDQSLGKIQLVCLHGKLPCKPNEITFSVQQYARRANVHDPLYDQFVRDHVTHPTIFIGTQFNVVPIEGTTEEFLSWINSNIVLVLRNSLFQIREHQHSGEIVLS